MSTSALDGVTVLVTRPREHADRLCDLIEGEGGTALRFPALEIAPRPDHGYTPEQVATFDIVIFVSLNAVKHGAALLPPLPDDEDAAPDSRRPAIAAVGPSTARALRAAGHACDIQADQGFSSEALLAEPELASVADRRILIVRGHGGRELLGKVLTERGAEVHFAEVYERTAPAAADGPVMQAMLDGRIDAVTATSVEILSNVFDAFEGMSRHALLDTQLVTISDRVVQKAAELGFKKPAITAAGPDDRALLEALLQWRQTPTPSVSNQGTQMQDAKSPDSPGDAVRDDTADEVKEQPGGDDAGTDSGVAAPPEPEPETAPPASPPPAAPARSGGMLGGLALLLALVALAGAAFTWWQQRTLPATLADANAQLATNTANELTALRRELSDLDARVQRVDTLRDSIDRLGQRVGDEADAVERVSGRLQNVESSLDALRGVSAAARQAWVRAEAEYFLETANQSLALVGDPDVALTALENADGRLRELGDPGLSRTRAVLADEIAALRAVPRVDIERIVHDLGSLAARVDSYPVDTDRPASFRAVDQGEAEGESGLERAWSSVKKSVEGMVTIRRSDEKVTPLLAPEETYFLKRNLELQLQAARLAALRGQKSNFQESLRASRSWLSAYFDTDNAGVGAAIETLAAMEAEDIDPALPDISGSLRQLRAAPKPVVDTP